MTKKEFFNKYKCTFGYKCCLCGRKPKYFLEVAYNWYDIHDNDNQFICKKCFLDN